MAPSLQLGSITIDWLCGGDFALDGGTMFGAVPKILWNKKYPADADNCIRLRNAPLLVRTPDTTLLIDTGLGNKLSEKQQRIFRVHPPWNLPGELASRGIAPDDVDVVILTHCDFDHAGGVVTLPAGGTPRLTFPRARHIVQQREWEDVLAPNIRAAHSYWPDNFTGLAGSGLLELVDGDADICEGVRVRLTGGHTRGHQLVEITGSDGCAVHLGDLFPTHAHANPLWIMAYDNFPLDLIEKKQELLDHYRQRGCWFTFYHDIHMWACRLDDDGQVTDALVSPAGTTRPE